MHPIRIQSLQYKTIDREGHKNFKIILINSSIFSI
jgi:hypothetical protein